MEFSVELDWLPPPDAKPNSRKGWRAKARAVAALRESGLAHGLEWLGQGGRTLRPPYSLTVDARCKRVQDGDNLLIGFKGFVDGLEDAGVLTDDGRITEWTIRVHKDRADGARMVIKERD